MVDLTKGPIPLCTVCIHGQTSTIWLFDPPDGSPPLPLSVRRSQLAELIRQGEETGIDPEYLAADRQTLQALDDFYRPLRRHFCPDTSAPDLIDHLRHGQCLWINQITSACSRWKAMLNHDFRAHTRLRRRSRRDT
jgi:hypothetical protein